MKNLALVMALFFTVTSCQVVEPTYQDVEAPLEDKVRKELTEENLDINTLDGKIALIAKLETELGYQISDVHEVDGRLVVERPPVIKEIAKEAGDVIIDNPDSPTSWIGVGLASVTAAGLALSGLRGRSTLRKEGDTEATS
jgi:hypothetical protein